MLFLSAFLIFLLFFTMSMCAYYGYGDLLVSYEKSNVMLLPFSRNVLGQFANLFVVLFLFVHTTLKFMPCKEMLMKWMLIQNRQSFFWHALATVILIITEMLLMFVVMRMALPIRSIINYISMVSAPIVGYSFPFFAFLRMFLCIRAEDRRCKWYTFLLGASIFIHLSIFSFWLSSILL